MNSKQTNTITVHAPAALPLAIAKVDCGDDGGISERVGVLGVALQHPTIELTVQPRTTATATGPRADIAAQYLTQLYKAWPTTPPTAVEIEVAIPAGMGLGSEAMIGLSAGRGLAKLSTLGREADDVPLAEVADETAKLTRALQLGPQYGLDMWSAAGGGLLLVDANAPADMMPGRLRHAAIAHEQDRDAWGFVIVEPRISSAIADETDGDRLATVLQCADLLDTASGRLVDDVLWPAVANDDLASFGQGLTALQALNRAALTKMGIVPPQTDRAADILAVMREHGAVACGQSASGLALYALVRGAQATIDMRVALRRVVTHTSGYMRATIVDNVGVRVI